MAFHLCLSPGEGSTPARPEGAALRNRKAFELAAGALLASKYAKVPDKLAGEVRAMWYQDRDGFIRSKPPADERAKAVGIRAATIRDWRRRPDWPDAFC